ncbi:MAG: hypothetical protein ACRD10_03275 [Terriglobia bacterium]
MNIWVRITVIVTAAGALVAVTATSAGLGRKLVRAARKWGKKSPEEIERLRRLELNRRGRITAAHIIDVIEDGSPEAPRRVVLYRYEVAGVTYEAAQEVSAFMEAELLTVGLAGSSSRAKYDPRQPLNSMIACEEWNGLDARR